MIPPSRVAVAASASDGRGWRLAIALFSSALLVTLVAYHETVASLVRVWRASDTFAHGFLIVPICGWLVWRKHEALASSTPRPYLPALILLPPLGLAWLVGHATGTLVVEHFSFVAMIPALVVAIFGPQVARACAFPLGFLFFAVPFGDMFQPFLMDFTARFAELLLRLTRVPVSRDGLFLTTPGAEWQVAEGCSGLRFLISGFALGCIFAHVAYRRTSKRLAFAALSIMAPILANGFRVYLIVQVGHLSQMRLGAGLDHYLYGWLVFAMFMAPLFAAGWRLRDREPQPGTLASPEHGRPGALPSVGTGRWMAVAGAAAVALGLWPIFSSYPIRPDSPLHGTPVSAPEPQGGWSTRSDPRPSWKPAYVGAASEAVHTYVKGEATVQCYIAFYEHQRQGNELIHYRNAIVAQDDPQWQNLGEWDRQVRLGRESLAVRETDVRSSDACFLVWHWYWLPDEFTASPGWAKVLQARASLVLRRDHAAVVVLAAPECDDLDAGRHLEEFVRDMLPSLRNALRQADRSR